MVEDRDERMRLAFTGRTLEIGLSHGMEHRLRMWIDRYNRTSEQEPGFEPGDLIDPDSDIGIAAAIAICASDGIRQDESEHGLHAFEWGDVISLDVADEMFRRGEWGIADGRD